MVRLVFTVMLVTPALFGLGTENFGDRPLSPADDWPTGLLTAADLPGRIYSRWINGGEVICYAGNTQAFNQALQHFSAIQAPSHRVWVKTGPGRIQPFQGREIRYDWRLDITGGLVRSQRLREGVTTAELAPTITCHTHNISLDELVVPENIDLVLPEDVNSHSHLVWQIEQILKWRTAKNKWSNYAASFLKQQRQRVKQTWPRGMEPPIGGYVEFQSQRVSKLFPNHKFYIIETNISSISNLFAVSVSGEVDDLAGYRFSSEDGNSPFRNTPFSSFLKTQQIPVPDANAALEIGKSIEELVSAPGSWMFIKHNSHDFKTYKTWLFNNTTMDTPNWQWFTEPCPQGWIVSRRYIGPPASIMLPPRWKLHLDNQKRITEVTH